MPADITLRRGAAADLPAAVALWHAAEVEGLPDPPPPPAVIPAPFRWELEGGAHWVAEREGAIVGYGAAGTRDGWTWLSSLFVRPDARSAGVGAALLERLLPRGHPSCTVSSTDFRAQALYIRHGLRPEWGHYHLMAGAARLRPAPPVDVEVIPAAPDDPALLDWDAELGGRRRPQDHAYWCRELGGQPLWFTRAGAPLGYGYAQTASPLLLDAPDAWTIGPLGARSAMDAAACTLAAVAWARERTPALRVALPGPHPALGPLLTLGFRIVYVEQFMTSVPGGCADPTRYVGSGSELF